ncbi:MAG: cytochrome ubiquinol oxidase subunit I [Candidatus Cryptobacteroides sp.]|nr:cytochrome ubiquinol oxidase subunit I [Candidatus Cryptobacteroides sp.]
MMESVITLSRAQFALTAFYHWMFVPLTLGLGIFVAILETIWYRKRKQEWMDLCKFWMKLFGINFAIGVATGIILEFEFGTNWSNYSWFVGDIFGAPLAIEGIFAFFCESTFFAVMMFGWKKFSPRSHLASTWLTIIGATFSAWWILVANSWMQHPVGMEFNPDQMRNVMTDFWAVAFSPVAVNKFCHTVFSSWSLGGVFVLGVSAWYLLKGQHIDFALKSIKIGGIVGLAGILLTIFTGDGSAVQVTKVQPMKLAAMEGLYEGQEGTPLIGFGIVNPDKTYDNDEDPMLFEISIPKGLSLLGRHDLNAFIPGIKDIIDGKDVIDGEIVNTVPYSERIERGKLAQEALRDYDNARKSGDSEALSLADSTLNANYPYFGYGYFNKVDEAIPNVPLVFYTFHLMVIIGGYLLIYLLIALILAYRKPYLLSAKWKKIPVFPLIALVSIPLVWICHQCGWAVAEVGRQPWTIQDILPVGAAISSVSEAQVLTTFIIFAVLFTVLLIAELSIMVKQIKKGPAESID